MRGSVFMNYATIKKTDVANGPGIRVSLFVSGCTHYCKGCFNSEAWDFGFGQPYTKETEKEILEALAPDYIRGLSLLGGEPMEPQNRGTVLELLKQVRRLYPQKDIWCYTGYDYEKDLLAWVAQEREASDGCRESGRMVETFGMQENVVSAKGEESGGAVCRRESKEQRLESEKGVEDPFGENGSGPVTQLLSLIDVLVDGEFVEEKKNLRLAFRGSENQRLIDVKKSLRQGRVVCLQTGP